MNRGLNSRVLEYAKANEAKRYEKVYVLFLWASSAGVIGIGLVVSVGVIYMLSKEYYILNAGECSAFVYASAFLLCASLLAVMSGILTCAITRTRGKFVLTILFGHLFAIGLIVSCLILTVKMSKLIEWSPYEENSNPIVEAFRKTITNSIYSRSWMRIHQNFRCCGIEDLELYYPLFKEFNITSLQKSDFDSKNPLENSTTSNRIADSYERRNVPVDLLFMIADQMQQPIQFCTNVARDAHRGCGILILSFLEKKTNLLKFYATLLLPMILIADLLCILGFLCFEEIKVSLLTYAPP